MAIMSCFEVPVQQPDRDMSVQEFKVWIKQFDMDHDKRISTEELTEALESLHMWFSSWKARRVMKDADADHTGFIDNKKEVEKLVKYAQQRLHMKIHQKS
ncbi:hypothetical protein EJD97_005668 [Solanum chilense]|uniref:EF-hand domain-containing protein n=2 Tax=Solanum subgen. Lycopersicon TaxID=49274 RepID=A0A3Q7FKK2_SOLLC|nr:hypothetical protein EJD97_005668 [Solanum chilense]